ncbi:hypothetical protein HK101_005510 [Irineochytrium annulatum]|nr:hypothetical protein HK101_005510 [Irineochytrium annulatum]
MQGETAKKLEGRVAAEGCVAVRVGADGARMVEVNCETDFVSRSDGFKEVVAHVVNGLPEAAGSGAKGSLFETKELEGWSDDVMRSAVGKMRENIKARRCVVGKAEAGVVYGGYAHGGESGMGRLGALVALRVSGGAVEGKGLERFEKFARQVAQQIVGFKPSVVREQELANKASMSDEELDGAVLLRQDFLGGGGKVRDVLKAVSAEIGVDGLEVVEFVRWECGEGIERKADDFKGEVMRAAGLA